MVTMKQFCIIVCVTILDTYSFGDTIQIEYFWNSQYMTNGTLQVQGMLTSILYCNSSMNESVYLKQYSGLLIWYVFSMYWTLKLKQASPRWWRHRMETFSALLAICAGNSPVTGEFPAQRPATRSFDVFFDLRLNKRLSKQSWGWWSNTPSRRLWRHCSAKHSSLAPSTHCLSYIYPCLGRAFAYWIVCHTKFRKQYISLVDHWPERATTLCGLPKRVPRCLIFGNHIPHSEV